MSVQSAFKQVFNKGRSVFAQKTYPYVILFLLGFFVLLYPMISQVYYRIESDETVENYVQGLKKIASVELEERMRLARAYNSTLEPSKLSDPYTDLQKEGVAAYAKMLEVEELIGHVEVPRIDEDIPIYAGTRNSILERGSGHLEGTSLPVGGASTHSVITAHRGLASRLLFRNLDQMKIGDVFFVHNLEGTLAYEVDQIITVEPTNFQSLIVTDEEDYCTLLTCTPYMINTHRLLVRGHRIPYESPEAIQKVDEQVKQNKPIWSQRKVQLIFLIALLFLMPLFVLIYLYYQKHKKKRKKLKANLVLEKEKYLNGQDFPAPVRPIASTMPQRPVIKHIPAANPWSASSEKDLRKDKNEP